MSPAAIVSAPQGRDALPWFDRDGVADFSFSATSMFSSSSLQTRPACVVMRALDDGFDEGHAADAVFDFWVIE